MPPPDASPYPFRRFVLLCPQRSGSNALTSLLNQHDGLRLYGQLFNNGLEYRRYHRHDLDLPLFRAHPETLKHFGLKPPLRLWLERQVLRFVGRERDLDRYLAAFWERFGEAEEAPGTVPSNGPARAVGFKLHDFQLTDADLGALFEDHLDQVVILWRRNLLRAAVSWAVAVRTGEWTRKKTEARAARAPVRLDLAELAWFIEKTQRSVATWQRLAEASGTPALTVTYEEHVVPKAIGPLAAFLGLEAAADVDFQTRKLSRPTYAHVRNARAIDAALGSAATGYLFEPTPAEADASEAGASEAGASEAEASR